MRRKNAEYILVCFFVLMASNVFAINPEDLFESGKRFFKLERWRECVETFDRLVDVWPNYKKNHEALYYRSIAAVRDLDDKVNDYRKELTDKIASDCESISGELDDDMSELNAAIAMSKIDFSSVNWDKLTNIKPDELKHYLLRKRHPNPQTEPMQTLKWVYAYEQNKDIKEPQLIALLELLKLKALWRYLLSPIAAEAEKEQLIKLKAYPLTTVFEKTLNDGFKKSQADLKKEFAILGYHYDFLKSNSFGNDKTKIKSKWFKYLYERGLHNKELLCPF